MKEGLSDSVIPDTHKWKLETGEIHLFGQKLWEVPLYRCEACGQVETSKNLHGSDEHRRCQPTGEKHGFISQGSIDPHQIECDLCGKTADEHEPTGEK